MRPRLIHIQLYPVPQFATYDLTTDSPDEVDKFSQLSIQLTGFSLAELQGTGMMEVYYDELGLVSGRAIRRKYLNSRLGPGALLGDCLWGPLTRNVIRMWYLGQWHRLPAGWGSGQFSDKDLRGFDEFGRNVDRIISPRAYKEGLAWRAVGVNPMGAKQPGFGSWKKAPR
jgi:hypothetical protein